jgi:hypothetical protein
MTRKKEKGWAVICPDGKIANNHIFEDKKEAERKAEILELLFGHKNI